MSSIIVNIITFVKITYVQRYFRLFFVIGVIFLLIWPLHAAILPKNVDIGQIIEPQEGSVEALAKDALSEPYTLDWIQRYVPASLQAGFVHTNDEALSTILGSTAIQMAKAIRRTQLWEVPFCIFGEEYWWGVMVWVEQNPGSWALLSLSLESEGQGR